MKRLFFLALALSVVSGAAGVILGGLGYQFPQVAVAEYCVEVEPWCGVPHYEGCPPGQLKTWFYDGWYPSTGVCCGAYLFREDNCHYPY